LICWSKRHQDFIKEKTFNDELKKWTYTHRQTRSAYRSLQTYLVLLL
ncbi:MAG: Unknown protein, partial [uncultured Campylobacterales bacterium]